MLKSGFLGTGWVTLGMSLNLPGLWHPHLYREKGADTGLTGQLYGARAGSQKALHTVSGHSQLHPSVICPVNKDCLTLMSSPILDTETTDDRSTALEEMRKAGVCPVRTRLLTGAAGISGGEIPA